MTPKRPEFQLILVVTEGTATEREYIERLGQYLRSETSTVRVKTVGVGKDPLSVVRKAVELRDGNAQPRLRGRKVAAKGSKRAKYDAVFCLVDVDDHASLPQAITLARQENIGILVSNLKFETWLLWHVEDRRAELNSRELDAMMAKHNLLTHKHLPTRFPF